jgi:tRNA A37 threonylcarbamoyladenosine dehydratase
MRERFLRNEMLWGKEAQQNLASSHVILFGLGGVGGYAAEALARAGIGKMDLIDNDTVSLTNLNRQLIALESTIGKYKTDCLRERLQQINPELKINAVNQALTPENISAILDNGKFDYVIDAIDSIRDKCFLLAECHRRKIPVISAMGAGCRLDASAMQYSDISKTFNCRLAKNVRAILKKEYNIVKGIECVFSTEPPLEHGVWQENPNERPTIGSTSFMPGIAGLMLAAKVLNSLADKDR